MRIQSNIIRINATDTSVQPDGEDQEVKVKADIKIEDPEDSESLIQQNILGKVKLDMPLGPSDC